MAKKDSTSLEDVVLGGNKGENLEDLSTEELLEKYKNEIRTAVAKFGDSTVPPAEKKDIEKDIDDLTTGIAIGVLEFLANFHKALGDNAGTRVALGVAAFKATVTIALETNLPKDEFIKLAGLMYDRYEKAQQACNSCDGCPGCSDKKKDKKE